MYKMIMRKHPSFWLFFSALTRLKDILEFRIILLLINNIILYINIYSLFLHSLYQTSYLSCFQKTTQSIEGYKYDL